MYIEYITLPQPGLSALNNVLNRESEWSGGSEKFDDFGDVEVTWDEKRQPMRRSIPGSCTSLPEFSKGGTAIKRASYTPSHL
jgi:hypothetical protein